MTNANPIVEVGPEMTEEERVQARRVWETRNTHLQERGEQVTFIEGRRYAPEPAAVTTLSPEQKLIGALMDIHPSLGSWAYDLAKEGFQAESIKARLADIITVAESD